MTVVEYDGRIVVVDVGLRFPTPEMVGHRPRAARLRLPARARRRHRGDRHHSRPRGPPRRAAVGPARARADDTRPRSTAAPLTIAMARSKLDEHKLRDIELIELEPGDELDAGPVLARADPHDPLDPRFERRRARDRARHRSDHRRLQVRPDARRRRARRRLAPGRARPRGRPAAVRRLDQRRPRRLLAVGVASSDRTSRRCSRAPRAGSSSPASPRTSTASSRSSTPPQRSDARSRSSDARCARTSASAATSATSRSPTGS